EVEELLVAVDAHAQVDLGDAVEPEALEDVDQVPYLDSIAGEEGQPLQQLAAARVLAGQRLQQPRELRIEEVDHRARRELGDAAAAGGLLLAAEAQWAAVEALHVADPGIGQQRPDGPVDELGMDVGDV